MKRNYIKMNDNNKYLSLGNILNVIKKVSNSKNAMQTELFCTIFGINNVNTTTINNYCIGIRAIGIEYKKIFNDNYDKYQQDKKVFINMLLSILSIIDDKLYIKDENSLETINKNIKLKSIIKELLLIANNDEHIDKKELERLANLSSYEVFIEILNYAINKNKQPIYEQSIDIIINKSELEEYLKVKLYWGESYINSLIELASKNNMYACADLGSLEFDGLVNGKVDYKKSYEYYLKAANKNHPKGCWMIANLMLTKRVEYDFETMWKYLNKSIELGSIAGYNTLGICYLRGINEKNEIDKEKAKYYFTQASELGYIYAFNNLGKIYELEGNEEEALKHYKISADMNESWALNKVGEYYRKNKDYKTAFIYYQKSIETPINERIGYGYYNLAKYYYENGNEEADIEKDTIKANEYYKIAKKYGIEE